MAKEKFVTGIDIGASKIRCLIGERGPQGVFNILACGVARHNCLKKGAVVNLKGLSDAISKAIYKAEEESEQKIHSAFINVTDPNAEGIPSHSEVIISDIDSEITHYDTERVINNARSINIPYEREIFHTVHHGYIVDGEKGIVDPAGMFGFKLEADLYLITVKAALVENLKKAVRQTGIGVAGVIIEYLKKQTILKKFQLLEISTEKMIIDCKNAGELNNDTSKYINKMYDSIKAINKHD